MSNLSFSPGDASRPLVSVMASLISASVMAAFQPRRTVTNGEGGKQWGRVTPASRLEPLTGNRRATSLALVNAFPKGLLQSCIRTQTQPDTH